MRKLFSAIFLFLFLVPLLALAHTVPPGPYTYDSKLDPGEFKTWTIIEESVQCAGSYCCGVLQNPDLNAKISHVLVCIDGTIRRPEGSGLIRYAYYDNGEIVGYVIMSNINNVFHYKQILPLTEYDIEAIERQLRPYVRISS